MAIVKGYNTTTINPLAYGNGPSITASNISQNNYAAIQGKMLTVNLVMDDLQYVEKPLSPDDIKMKLMELLVEKMRDDNHIEFTKMQDISTGEHKFHARIFVVPDTQVRILREKKVDITGPW
jgi:hypothetical protein